MKGIILAGGRGTRLHPLTLAVSKQLLPVYDKPLIYYSLSTLMLANIREILIIVMPNQLDRFQLLLGDGKSFGIEIQFKIQESPAGIADSHILGESFLAGSKSALVLGDNIFHGVGLGRALERFGNINGAQVFGFEVKDFTKYGIATLDEGGGVTTLVEKPVSSKSSLAIPGLYFFDETASVRAKELKPSVRGELEIIDLLKSYLADSCLNLELLPRGTAWFDSGTIEDLFDASTFVKLMQERTGQRVGDPFEIAKTRGWLS